LKNIEGIFIIIIVLYLRCFFNLIFLLNKKVEKY